MNFLLVVNVFMFVLVKADDGDICEIDACQALEQSQMHLREFADSLEDDNVNLYLVRLERRVRALEHPGKKFIVFKGYFKYHFLVVYLVHFKLWLSIGLF